MTTQLTGTRGSPMGGALSSTRDEGERMWNGIGILVAPRLALSELSRHGRLKTAIPESVDCNTFVE